MLITNLHLGEHNKIKQNMITLGDETALVKEYISSQEKIEIISTVIEEAGSSLLLDQVSLDALFTAYVILSYTDIEFESRQVEDLLKFYDYFEAQGFATIVINAIPKVEYDALVSYLKDTVDDFNRIKTSATGALESLVRSVPKVMEEIKRIIDETDMDSLSLIKEIYSKFEH